MSHDNLVSISSTDETKRSSTMETKINEALHAIEENGAWWRGDPANADQGKCLSTGLWNAWGMTDHDDDDEPMPNDIGWLIDMQALQATIRDQFPDRYDDSRGDAWVIPSFNDHPNTTWDDVVLVAQKAMDLSMSYGGGSEG